MTDYRAPTAARHTVESEDARNSRDGDEENDLPKSKRRRTAVACTACRVRKSRCNGKRPRCSMCESLDFECVYEASGSSINLIVNKDHMTEVESRLHQLEAKMERQEQAFDTYEQRFRTIEKTRFSANHTLLPPGHNATFHSSGTAELRSAGVQDLFPEEASTDGMAITYIDEEDSGYFGQTSNISFMRHISRAMILAGNLEGISSPLKSTENTHGIISVSRPASPAAGGLPSILNPEQPPVMLNMLPSETDTRELIGRYFSNTGRLFPYINEATFMNSYEEMKAANFTKVRRTWLGLLNMVLAMAFNASSDPPIDQSAKQRIAQSDVFYQRAFGLCQTQILRGTSLETVQYLLLMSQYLQGTQKSVQTWAIHGLAVKAAQSLGLHSNNVLRRLSPVEREFGKRTWFGCVILDRTLSMTFGRPMAIPEDHVRLPLPETLDDHVPTSEHDSAMQQRSVMFYNATINLYSITARVISTLYGGNLGCDPLLSKKEIASKIFQFEQEIDEWSGALPECLLLMSSLSLPQHNVEDPLWTKFRIILSLRSLNLQVLLYRPVFKRAIDQNSEEQAHMPSMRSANHMETNHIQSCLASAKEIIDIVHGVVTLHNLGRHFLGAWWFSLYYVFNAALMIFGSLMVNPRHTGGSERSDQIRQCRTILARAIQVLYKLDEGNVTVQRCAQFLEQMSHKLGYRRGFMTGHTEGPKNSATDFSTMESGTDDAQVIRLVPSLNQQDNGTSQTLQEQDPDTTGFMFDGIYGDELELGQFFVGGVMEAWIDGQE